MKKINLHQYYYFAGRHEELVVSDEVYYLLEEERRYQKNYAQYIRDHRAYYSLDYGDSIERSGIARSNTPEEELIRKELYLTLWHAFWKLSNVQRKRIYAHVVMGYRHTKIARLEEVDESAVRKSIRNGLHIMKNRLTIKSQAQNAEEW